MHLSPVPSSSLLIQFPAYQISYQAKKTVLAVLGDGLAIPLVLLISLGDDNYLLSSEPYSHLLTKAIKNNNDTTKKYIEILILYEVDIIMY